MGKHIPQDDLIEHDEYHDWYCYGQNGFLDFFQDVQKFGIYL